MDIPYEILVYIFKHLPKSDRLAASETCRLWYQAANDTYFIKHKYITFYSTQLNTSNSPLKIFEKSILDYTNYVFKEVELPNELCYFWDNVGPIIKKLTIRSCDICEKAFIYIMQKCTNLEELGLENCKELFMSGCLLEGKTEGFLTQNLEELKSLSLLGNTYLSDALFNRFVSVAPKLQELNLSSCSMQFHLGLVKKFYPAGTDVILSPSESVLTFYFILNFIISRAPLIKRLYFNSTLIDGSGLRLLAEIEDLELEVLHVNSCDQLTRMGILALCTLQTSLRELDIGMCTRVTDQSLVYISDSLTYLEKLSIQRCRAVTDAGIAGLSKLKNLKHLNISQCDLITKEGIEKGVCGEDNTLLELDVHCLNLDESALIMISEKLPKLQLLDISYCFNAVTDISIQMVFKNQLMLHTLKMSHCDKVSDAGLTGMGTVDESYENEGPVNSVMDTGSPYKIYLGSKAEEEIVRDARRKEDIKNLCEKINTSTCTGYSMARLINLKVLDLSNCNRITDVSITYAFKFKELYDLNLSRCQQITHKGMKHLVAHCPSIEYLNLSDCYNLNDVAISTLVKNLRRLKYLHLKGCDQLTDKSLDSIKIECEKLKYIDLQGCGNLSSDLALTLTSIPTLHTIYISRANDFVDSGNPNGEVKRKEKFLPILMRKLKLSQ